MKINNETKIGLLVIAVLVMLGYITWEAGEFSFAPKGYEVKVRFHNIDGIETNAPVTLNGLEVGRVNDIKIKYEEKTVVELALWLKSHAKIHEGAKAYVKNMGFLGEKYVGLTTGDDTKPFLQSGAVIIGQEPTSFDKVLEDGEEIAFNLKEISQQINERLKVNSEAIDDVIQNMRLTMKNVTSISDQINAHLTGHKEDIDAMLVNFSATSLNLEELSLDLKENPWKLLYKPKKRRK